MLGRRADGKRRIRRFPTLPSLTRNDGYWFTVFLQKDGAWAQEFKIHYKRK
jgi:hypothetical protein